MKRRPRRPSALSRDDLIRSLPSPMTFDLNLESNIEGIRKLGKEKSGRMCSARKDRSGRDHESLLLTLMWESRCSCSEECYQLVSRGGVRLGQDRSCQDRIGRPGVSALFSLDGRFGPGQIGKHRGNLQRMRTGTRASGALCRLGAISPSGLRCGPWHSLLHGVAMERIGNITGATTQAPV